LRTNTPKPSPTLAASLVLGVGIALLRCGPAAAQPTPLTIGVIEDLSGIYSSQTGNGQVVAAQMAIDDFGGAVLGRPIKIIVADHQNKADVASTTARRWFDTDGVAMIAGLGNSAVALAVQSVARDKGRIDIVTSAGSSDLTGRECSSTGFHWAFDTEAVGNVVASTVTRAGGKRWYFISADYAFGAALQATATRFVLADGGDVVGVSKVPIATADYSTYLLAAQSTNAQVVALANGGDDTDNAIKQAAEFGLTAQGLKLAALSMYINNVAGLGLKESEGLYMSESFYWDLNDDTRAWSKRYFDKVHVMPNMLQAGMYSGVTHYLKAIAAAGSDDGLKVAAVMHATKVNDFYTKDAPIRPDGLVIRPMYLLQVKTPAESKGPWDLLKVIAIVPGEQAFGQPNSACMLNGH
jgi:branched-chain amino acid transport system substrate-binding protein